METSAPVTPAAVADLKTGTPRSSRSNSSFDFDPYRSPRASRFSIVSQTLSFVRDEAEGWWNIASQIGIPFLIAGLGMTGAGILLEHVAQWQVYKEISELLVLTTPLLGLKGDLEMTLASRLSTQANLGNMDKPGNKWRICFGNLCLDQLQAIICGLVAAAVAIITSLIKNGVEDHNSNSNHALLICAASISTASIVSIVLGSTMVTVVLLARRFKINPDNVATPVAGSLGDVVTLGFLSLFADWIFHGMKNHPWIPYTIFGVFALVAVFCFRVALRNEFTRPVLISGWIPVIASVLISCGGGIILDSAEEKYPTMTLYQPVINGIGGNLVSVQASRISTSLHKNCEAGKLPEDSRVCESPIAVFFKTGGHAMCARLLLIMAIPGHFLFATIAHYASGQHEERTFSWQFLGLYVLAAIIQIILLLYIAKILTNICWHFKMDPDTSSIPYLTAFGDLFGSALLLAAFEILPVT